MELRNSKENSIQKRNSQIKVAVALLCLIILITCFVAGTAVLMASGTSKAIENVHVGDVVKSYNSVTGKVSDKRVLQTFENETDELVKVSTSDGQEIISTPGHKFYANSKWVSAEDLRAGDILVNVNGEKVVVEQVQHEILDNPVKIYNFEVADNHNYYVGEDSASDSFVLVHNRACDYRKKLLDESGLLRNDGFDVHHQIPQKIAKDYKLDQYVDINDVKYLEWVEEHAHRSKSRAYNKLWKEELDKAGEINKEVIEEIWNKLKNFFKNGGII